MRSSTKLPGALPASAAKPDYRTLCLRNRSVEDMVELLATVITGVAGALKRSGFSGSRRSNACRGSSVPGGNRFIDPAAWTIRTLVDKARDRSFRTPYVL